MGLRELQEGVSLKWSLSLYVPLKYRKNSSCLSSQLRILSKVDACRQLSNYTD